MKSITINGSKREHVGKVATKALRNAVLRLPSFLGPFILLSFGARIIEKF